MENKLQELTKKLYDEGLSRGRQEAETLIAEAHAEARRIVDEARAESERILREAEENAADLNKNTTMELNLAGRHLISRLKREIREMVVAKATGGSVKEAAMDPAFIKDMLIAAGKNWHGASSGRTALVAMLPETMKGKLDDAVEKSVRNSLDGGMEITYSDAVKSGFRIGPKDGSYYINFTDDGFDALLGEYLRPKVSEILYGTSD